MLTQRLKESGGVHGGGRESERGRERVYMHTEEKESE